MNPVTKKEKKKLTKEKKKQSKLNLPSSKTPQTSKWVKSKEGFSVSISPECFARAQISYINAMGMETMGLFYIDKETEEITWLETIATGSGGHVDATEEEVAAATAKCPHGAPMGQWHTHPDMGVFWSPTDTNDQVESIEAAVDMADLFGIAKITQYFIVFDRLDWLVRKVTWEKGEGDDVVTYADGVVTLIDKTLCEIKNVYGWSGLQNNKGLQIWNSPLENNQYIDAEVGDIVEFRGPGDSEILVGVVKTIAPSGDQPIKVEVEGGKKYIMAEDAIVNYIGHDTSEDFPDPWSNYGYDYDDYPAPGQYYGPKNQNGNYSLDPDAPDVEIGDIVHYDVQWVESTQGSVENIYNICLEVAPLNGAMDPEVNMDVYYPEINVVERENENGEWNTVWTRPESASNNDQRQES